MPPETRIRCGADLRVSDPRPVDLGYCTLYTTFLEDVGLVW